MKNYGYADMSEKEKLSKEQVLEFWKNPINDNTNKNENNDPEHYLSGEKRSRYLVELIKRHLHKEAKILEIGCNVGRNLHYLYETGYNNLNGIEINDNAVQVMHKNYPELYGSVGIYNCPVESIITSFSDEAYDLVFTMAVLEHIHYESDFIFSEIARVAKRCIITIEDEKTTWSNRHFPRNYKEVFEKIGNWVQIYDMNCGGINILDDRFWVRVFKKNV